MTAPTPASLSMERLAIHHSQKSATPAPAMPSKGKPPAKGGRAPQIMQSILFDASKCSFALTEKTTLTNQQMPRHLCPTNPKDVTSSPSSSSRPAEPRRRMQSPRCWKNTPICARGTDGAPRKPARFMCPTPLSCSGPSTRQNLFDFHMGVFEYQYFLFQLFA